jgi:hypothetical protein
MNLRPTILFHEPTFKHPVDVFPLATFYQLTGFWPGQFEEICDILSLLPDAVVCPDTHCRSSKNLALFLLLWCWNKADTWEDVSRLLHHPRVWCIKIYHAIFNLLAIHYRKLVQVIDYCQIMPLLESWSADMVHFCGYAPDVLFFTDDKPWKMAQPGRSDASAGLVRAAGGNNINLVQQAYYNGHYGFSGEKVQHVLQADGICYSFTCPLRRHDAMVLQESSILTMFSVLYVNIDPLQPVKCVTDKAYGRTNHLCPLHTSLELCLMNPADRATAEEEDSKNKGPRMSVEISFNNIVRKFTHTDYFTTHRILQSGRSNWPYLRCLWDFQVLFL